MAANKRNLMPAALLVFSVFTSGCTTTHPELPATSAAPNLPPQEEARQIMGEFDVTLPPDAQQVRVVKPPLENFRAKAVISFTAPPDEVLNETCQNITEHPNYVVFVPGIDNDILTYAGVTFNEKDYAASCERYEGGRKILVLIPQSPSETTYVVLYHMPYR